MWGECLRAPRPLSQFAEDAAEAKGRNTTHLQQPRFEDVDPENRPQVLDQENLPGHEPIECFPHAALAMAMATSTAATWGSAPSLCDSATDPSDEREAFESTFSDNDEFPIGPDSADDQELSPEEDNNEVNKEESENVFQSNIEVDITEKTWTCF